MVTLVSANMIVANYCDQHNIFSFFFKRKNLMTVYIIPEDLCHKKRLYTPHSDVYNPY